MPWLIVVEHTIAQQSVLIRFEAHGNKYYLYRSEAVSDITYLHMMANIVM